MVLNRNLAKSIRSRTDQVNDLVLLDAHERIAHTLNGLPKEQHDERVTEQQLSRQDIHARNA